MKASLQQEGIVYWLLMQKYLVVRVYGFSAASFMLPFFLTPSVFALELIRQRISIDEEHFTAHRKDSWIKYPINFGPFVLRNPTTLPMVEKFLKAMKFQVTHAQNSDPKGIISQRRFQVQRSVFIHSMILELSQRKILFPMILIGLLQRKFKLLRSAKYGPSYYLAPK